MFPDTQKLSVYKSQLRVVLTNLKKMEHASSATFGSLCCKDLQALMVESSEILNRLEAVPLTKIIQNTQKRRRKRKKAKLRRNKLRHPAITYLTHKNNISNESSCKIDIFQIRRNSKKGRENSSAVRQKLHQRLRSYRDSNRFLQIFELLELLYKARTQNEWIKEFSSKIRKLRSIWNVIQLENVPMKTLNEDILNQWYTVLFGEQKQTFYKREKTYKDLISVRQEWDSYITQDLNTGSKIPFGWVLPSENPDPSWRRYAIQ